MDGYVNKGIYDSNTSIGTEFKTYDYPELCVNYITEELDPNVFINPSESVLYTCNRIRNYNSVRYNNIDEIYETYDNIINKIVLFINNISNSKDAITYSTIITKLLWNGILSIDGNFRYNDEDLEIKELFNGLNVIYGEGCCRHISSVLKEIFNKMFQENYCVLGKNKVKFGYDIFSILRNDLNGLMNNINGPVMYDPNTSDRHVLNMISYNDRYYLFDATNLVVFKLKKNLKNNLYFGDGSIEIRPCSFLTYNNINSEQLRNILYKLDIKKDYLQEDELVAIIKNAINITSFDLMSDLHNEIKSELNELKDYKVKVLRKNY